VDDTWGISGPAFLILFLGAAATILALTLWQRRQVFRGPDHVNVESLSPQQLAFLNGGRQLAMQTSLLWLRQSGAVSHDGEGKLTRVSGHPAQGATELDRAVLHAASTGAYARTMISNNGVRTALTRMEDSLIRAGLAVAESDRRAVRRGPWLLLLLVVVGFVRLVVGLGNDKPVLLLALSLAVLSPVAFVLFRRPVTTKAARAALDRLRRRHSYLAPAQRPAFDTYGPASTALAVGLFGGAVLWQADPALALESQAIAARNAGASTGGGSTGCGSSSGGGSSCGGGGGCGGGGCGG
jgi:uncharacterized protein (TIGR04222 family)